MKALIRREDNNGGQIQDLVHRGGEFGEGAGESENPHPQDKQRRLALRPIGYVPRSGALPHPDYRHVIATGLPFTLVCLLTYISGQ